MNKIERFIMALQYFKIAFFSHDDITLKLLKQAKHDGNYRAYDAYQFSALSQDATHIESSYDPNEGVYTFKIRTEEF